MSKIEDFHANILAENERIAQQRRANNNLQKAKELEAKRIKSGYKWIADGKTWRLVSPQKLQENGINADYNQNTE